MKKLFYGAAAALLLVGAASCEKSGADSDSSKVFSQTASDSLVTSFGQLVGSTLNAQIDGAMQQDSTLTKEAFLKGLQYAFAADTAQAYSAGVNLGLQMQNEFRRFEQMGVNVDRSRWLNAFKTAFLQDSVPSQDALAKIQQDFQAWNDSLRNAKRAFDLRELENSEKAQTNLTAGKAYVDSVKKADPAVTEAASGIAYKIENAGEGKVKSTDKVVLKVNGKALSGQNPPAIPENPLSVNVLPKGLQEAVTLLGKGGKATFYIPGRMVYELDMAQRMGIEPNALMIYEVEVVDIPAAEAPGVPAAPTMQPVK